MKGDDKRIMFPTQFASKVEILTCLILSEEGLRYPDGMELRWSVTASAGDTRLT